MNLNNDAMLVGLRITARSGRKGSSTEFLSVKVKAEISSVPFGSTKDA